MSDIWTEIMADTSEGSFPNAEEFDQIFVESMDPTFSTIGDAMGPGILYGTRAKLIHSVGAVGKVRFIPSYIHPGDFTGIFKGADYGLIRLSSAAKPDTSSQPLAPGMGLKFLRDGMDSANLVSMYSVDGTPDDWNFFSKHFTTHISAASSSVLKLLAAKFAT